MNVLSQKCKHKFATAGPQLEIFRCVINVLSFMKLQCFMTNNLLRIKDTGQLSRLVPLLTTFSLKYARNFANVFCKVVHHSIQKS